MFRLIFVVFSLYLLGDVFYRWDGFRYHSTFSEFLPSVALVSILWSVVAVCTAILIWILLKLIEWMFKRFGYEVRAEHFIVFAIVLIISGILVWKVKRLLWPLGYTSQDVKIIVFICVFLLSLFLSWLLRYRVVGWVAIILERITPLAWLFGAIVFISIPIVTYHIALKDTNKKISQKIVTESVSGKERPNIILVMFDTLTARDMSVYGYHRQTTPFISNWAKEATIFTNLQAASNWTTPSTASLMTGKRVWTHQASHLNGALPLKSNIESLPLLLKQNGYFNIAIVVNPVASVETLGIAGSFDMAPQSIEFSTPHSLLGGGTEAVGMIDKILYKYFANKFRLHDWIVNESFILGKLLSKVSRDISSTTVPPEKAFSRLLEILDNNPPEPYFAWIHVLPPHAPYLPPEPYMGMFDSSQKMRTYKKQWEILDKRSSFLQYEHFPADIQPSIDILRARYDEFIRHCDNQFEEFIKQLTKRDNMKDTIIMLSSDHGESFEHAYLAHGGPYLYEQVTHVPLIIKEPMQDEGISVNDLVEQVDISSTILELAAIQIPSWMEGRSLVPLMRGQQLQSKPAFSMNLESNPRHDQQITKGVISVWEGDYKLIYDLNKETSRLFNLKEDPDELKDLYNKEPHISQTLLKLIYDNLDRANKRMIN